ncbi:MAG: tetratricopeptide repeat protein [Candidatus Brocadiia bacterium]|nr:MAG: tetratricopeptide repeat protein [Candidatus Brocadiia bacterium]
MAKIKFLILLILCSFSPCGQAESKLTQEQAQSLLEQANEAFRHANSATSDSEKADKLYTKAILNFEKIISEGQIQNAGLYYNLANAYFLQGNIGKAILNYRKAEKLDNSDTNIRKNLAFARSKRIDKVSDKPEKRVMQTLFFWHYDFAIKTKFLLTCIFFGIFCISLTRIIWSGRSPSFTAIAVISGILTFCFMGSVVWESTTLAVRICGVITAESAEARQGDGMNYPASFKDPLHAGTEFDLLEIRPGWLQIRLSDGSDGWIPDSAAELI